MTIPTSIPRLMIAAPHSGSGKSMVASGLMAAFSKRFAVRGFKVGPDYIDPMYHAAATGVPSYNLDNWMLTPDETLRLFLRVSRGAALNIVEGVMGLFDGAGSDPFDGSSAGVARLLKTPVILVLDCASMSGSAAAVVHGFNTFSAELRLSGVICNRVGGEAHAAWLKEAIEGHAGVPVLGCIPHLEELRIPERHLGLFTVAERPAAVAGFLARSAAVLERYLDLDRLLAIANAAENLPDLPKEKETAAAKPSVRLAVARDEAFCFYYEDTFDELRRAGAEIVPFSPLSDAALPAGIDGLYFGGGYPELYAEKLSANAAMRARVLAACRAGMPVYAECGGLMYLTAGIRTGEGSFRLVGALPGWCEMGGRLVMGYRQVETANPSLLGEVGMSLRGHEFHFSHWKPEREVTPAYRITGSVPVGEAALEGFTGGNILASYVHLYFGQDHRLADHFVRRCREWRAVT